MKTILVVDDERDIIDLLVYNLHKEGYKTLTARNGAEAIEKAHQQPNLILLDVMLPICDGWEVLRRLKQDTAMSQIPVIFLTAKVGEVDEALGLELGADDYIVKPISLPKLLARIRTVLRRQDPARPETGAIRLGAIEINTVQHSVQVDKHEVFFPRKEFEVLAYLARHNGQAVSRESLLNAIWGSDANVVDRTVDVHIRKIREKLGGHSDYIKTIKGVGYRMALIE
jgi:two-component system alkaline phosphatase synthesis response regulator PhoP